MYPEDIEEMKWELERATPHELVVTADEGYVDPLVGSMTTFADHHFLTPPTSRTLDITPWENPCLPQGTPIWKPLPGETQSLGNFAVPVADVYSANDGTVGVEFKFGTGTITTLGWAFSAGLEGGGPTNDWATGSGKVGIENKIEESTQWTWPEFL